MEIKLLTSQSLEVLRKETTLTRYLALSLFLILPFIGGYIGYINAPEKITEITKVVTVPEKANRAPELEKVFDGVSYNIVYVNGLDATNKFLEHSNNLYIKYINPFEGSTTIKKIDGVPYSTSTDNFESVGDEYIKNDQYVIFTGVSVEEPKLVTEADPDSFYTIQKNSKLTYGIDAEHVYFRGMLLDGINPKTMKFIESENYSLNIVHDEDTYWFPVGNCHFGGYRLGTAAEVPDYKFPCS